jgi:hypothetical protein
MASQTWTLPRVVAEVLEDPRLSRARDRCGVLYALTRWEDMSREDYATAGGGVCRDYALDAYPWTEVAATGE